MADVQIIIRGESADEVRDTMLAMAQSMDTTVSVDLHANAEAVLDLLNNQLAERGMVAVIQKLNGEDFDEAAQPEPEPDKKPKKRGRPKKAETEAKKAETEAKKAEPEKSKTATNSENFDEAVKILSTAYTNGEDGKNKVKALLMEYGVKRFAEINAEQFGTKLLEEAKEIQAAL